MNTARAAVQSQDTATTDTGAYLKILHKEEILMGGGGTNNKNKLRKR